MVLRRVLFRISFRVSRAKLARGTMRACKLMRSTLPARSMAHVTLCVAVPADLRQSPTCDADREQRWARDISIITADEAYFRAFCIVRSVVQCVLESSGTVT